MSCPALDFIGSFHKTGSDHHASKIPIIVLAPMGVLGKLVQLVEGELLGKQVF